MRLSMRIKHSSIIQFLKFSLVGLSNTVITYCVYCILISIGMQYIFSYIVGFFVGMINSFFLNGKYVFPGKNKKSQLGTFTKMVTVYFVIGIILGNIILFGLVEKLCFSKYFAPVIVLLFTTPLNFLLNKYWAFNTAKKEV